MENLKMKLKAVAQIGEKLLLIGVGLGGLYACFARLKDQNLSTLTMVIAIVALVFGLAPMVWNYTVSVWPKKNK